MTIPDGLRTTPFSPRYAEQVEEWIDVYGHAVPLWIGDPEQEYAAVRGAVGLLEYSMLYKWWIEGPDARSVANNAFSRDVLSQPAGHLAYGVITDSDGFMVDDVTVSVFSDDTVLVVGGNEGTIEYLQSVCVPGTTVTERRDDTAVVSIQGPNSRALLQRLTDHDLSNEAFAYYTFQTDVLIAGIPVQINRVGFTAELGYEVVVPRSQALELWDALVNAGDDLGVTPFGAAALMMCRIESGMIMGEVEYDHTVTPFECRMGWALDLDKPGWIGRDALVAKKDSVRGRVVTIQLDADPESAEGATLTHGGKAVGFVTMAVPSPVLEGATLAMARLDKDAAAVGTQLGVQLAAGTASATVVRTPVYDPERLRVRS